MFRDQKRLTYEDDRALVERLPSGLAGEVADLLAGLAIPLEAYLSDVFGQLWETWGRNQSERTRIQLAPHNFYSCSDEALVALREHAERHSVGIHVHLLETAYQKEDAGHRTGTTAVRHLHRLGFLGPDVTLGHAVWLTDDDLDLVAETGTLICHQASSNLRLQSGIAPLNAFLTRDIPVAIGIDEAGLNDDRDLLQEMRLVLKLHRVPGIDAPVPTAPEVLRMATEHGARTTHNAAEIATLEPGKAADLVLLNWRQLAHPYLDPDVPVVDAILHRARPAAVDTVLVAGEVVLRDGRGTRLNKQEVLEELAASLRLPLRPDELRRRELSRELIPHVKQFYEGWLNPESRDPFYRSNSRS